MWTVLRLWRSCFSWSLKIEFIHSFSDKNKKLMALFSDIQKRKKNKLQETARRYILKLNKLSELKCLPWLKKLTWNISMQWKLYLFSNNILARDFFSIQNCFFFKFLNILPNELTLSQPRFQHYYSLWKVDTEDIWILFFHASPDKCKSWQKSSKQWVNGTTTTQRINLSERFFCEWSMSSRKMFNFHVR